MMGKSDELLDLMYKWLEQRERCAKQLRVMAQELEVLRERCNAGECVGNSVSVLGAASLIGAGVATSFTGGLAAPLLAVLGAASMGVGLTVSLVTLLTEHLSSSNSTKEAQRIERESEWIAYSIQHMFEQLKEECKAEECKTENSNEDTLEQRVMAQIPAALARRSGQKWTVSDSTIWSSLPQLSLNATLLRPVSTPMAAGVAGILVFFALKVSGKKAKLLFAKAGQELLKKMSTIGLKTALKGGSMVVGGVVGLAFALPDAIDSWKEMIKNNHVTEVSKSLRDTADALDQMCRTLRKQFGDMKIEMDRKQQEYENRPR